MTIDPDTLHNQKVAKYSAYKRQISIGFSTSLFFVAAVIASQVALLKVNYEIEKLEEE